MGDRAQILVEETGVYIYSHWQGYEIEDMVRRGLAHRERWKDPEYLTRILADQVSAASSSETTGVGIGTEQAGDIHTLVRVSCTEQTVSIDPQSGDRSQRYTFAEFIESTE